MTKDERKVIGRLYTMQRKLGELETACLEVGIEEPNGLETFKQEVEHKLMELSHL